MYRALLCAALAFLSPAPALAGMWVVDQAKSQVSFSFTENGVRKSGVFEQFDARIAHDLENPDATRALVRIGTPSLELGDALRETIMRSSPWLDTDTIPVARFQLTKLAEDSNDSLSGIGIITIKRRAQPVSFVTTLTEAGGSMIVAKGNLTINRDDFEIGDPTIEAFVDIGSEIDIEFTITASPADR